MLNDKHMPKNWIAYDNYRTFLRDIAKKFIDSFYILRALTEYRHGKERYDSLPLTIKTVNLD